MIDFEHIEKYRENNRIEAKKALGGLPKSLWETYSAFANTLGGILLLGVVELPDKSFHTVNLPEPEKLIAEFWDILEDRERVNENILTRKDVAIHEIGGNRIISITIPRADRRRKPVYIGNNPYLGTYRRDGEGDYHCSEDEVHMMLRDREERTQDGRVLTQFGEDAFDYETLRRYRTYLKDINSEYGWNRYSDAEVLCRIGAGEPGGDGELHPTAAGLLMFGFEDEIVKEFPHYFLDYQEMAGNGSIEERIISNSGKWSGNLFDFYLRISGKIVRGIPEQMHRAVREAVANCMMNGDYFGTSGLVLIKKREEICITNPGSFRIDIEEAVCGGKSDPRNAGLAKLLNLVNIGTHTGKGVPDMYQVWANQGFKPPVIKERFRPDRITLTLPLYEEYQTVINCENPGEMKEYKNQMIEYVTRAISIGSREAAELFDMEEETAERLLRDMVQEGIMSFAEEGGFYLKI